MPGYDHKNYAYQKSEEEESNIKSEGEKSLSSVKE